MNHNLAKVVLPVLSPDSDYDFVLRQKFHEYPNLEVDQFYRYMHH